MKDSKQNMGTFGPGLISPQRKGDPHRSPSSDASYQTRQEGGGRSMKPVPDTGPSELATRIKQKEEKVHPGYPKTEDVRGHPK